MREYQYSAPINQLRKLLRSPRLRQLKPAQQLQQLRQLRRGLAGKFAARAQPRGAGPGQGAPLPVYEGRPLVGHLVEVMRDPLALCMDTMRHHGEMVRVPVGLHEFVFVSAPRAYEHVLIRNFEGYDRGLSHQILRTVIGLGMLTAEHPEWLPTRKAAAPRFASQSRREMLPIIDRHLTRWERRWDAIARTGETRELAFDLMCLTSQIAWEALFGYHMSDEEGAQFTADFVGLQDDLFKRLRLPLLPPGPGSFARLRRIEALARKLGASPGAGELEAQTMTMLATAPENPSNALAWAIYELARHPRELERVRAELASNEGSRHIDNVIHETLRLYPGAWIYERIARADDVVAGYHVPAGSSLVFSPYATHRDPKYWPDPDQFMPARFDGDALREQTPFSFVPFSVGPRRCVGDRYSAMIISSVLARFVARYDVSLDESERGETWPMFTLRPRTGIRARLTRVVDRG